MLFVTHDIDESVYLSDRVVVLTHAPTEVKEIVAVDLPWPRDQIATKELPEFAHLRAHVYRLIKREQTGAARSPNASTRRRRGVPLRGRGAEMNERRIQRARQQDEQAVAVAVLRGPSCVAAAARSAVPPRRAPAKAAGDRDHGRRDPDREHAAARPRDQEGVLRRSRASTSRRSSLQSGNDIVLALANSNGDDRLRRLGAGDDRAHERASPSRRSRASEVEGDDRRPTTGRTSSSRARARSRRRRTWPARRSRSTRSRASAR